MTTRAEIVTAARSRLGVEFRHQGRNSSGLDCVGLVIVVAHELGLSDFQSTAYPRSPDPDEMRAALEANLDYVRWDAVQPGDVLWFRAPEPQHLAIVTQTEPMQMIHAFSRVGKVVETSVDQFWRRRVVACFKYRGVQ